MAEDREALVRQKFERMGFALRKSALGRYSVLFDPKLPPEFDPPRMQDLPLEQAEKIANDLTVIWEEQRREERQRADIAKSCPWFADYFRE